MAKVFLLPDGFNAPDFNWEDINQYEKDCLDLVERLKKWCIERNNQKNVGEIIKFQVDDGYAEYMVAATKPVQLIHLPLGDAWCFQYANRLTKKDIVEKVNQQKNIAKFFADRQK